MTCQKLVGGNSVNPFLLGILLAACLAVYSHTAKGSATASADTPISTIQPDIHVCKVPQANTDSSLVFRPDVLKGQENLCRDQKKPEPLKWDLDMANN